MSKHKSSEQITDDRGRSAQSPWQIPATGWWDILKRTWKESSEDNIGLIAAGVAFYAFLALIPMLLAIVLVYGLAAEPATVMRDMQQLVTLVPAGAANTIGDMLMTAVQGSDGKKGVGLLVALAVALFGARNAVGAIISALNVAYEENEKRGTIHLAILAIGMTAAAVVVAVLGVLAITAMAALGDILPEAGPLLVTVGKVASYAVLALVGAAGAATLYRYGPSRERAKWSWITPGSLFAATAWLVLTLGFGAYVSNFGNYEKSYGSIAGVIVLLTWIYLCNYALLVGAELNSEIEHQTAEDSTEGSDAPIGARGAWAADHVADEAS